MSVSLMLQELGLVTEGEQPVLTLKGRVLLTRLVETDPTIPLMPLIPTEELIPSR